MFVCILAEYALATQGAVSTESTRYYLNGFHVQAHNEGVVIASTDGHVMSLHYDGDGLVEGHCIVQLSKAELAACKAKSTWPLWLMVHGDHAKSHCYIGPEPDGQTPEELLKSVESIGAGVAFRSTAQHFIDGSFPDFWRVIPRFKGLKPGLRGGSLNSSVVQRVASCGRTDPRSANPPFLQFWQKAEGEPIVVRSGRRDWIGIAMPGRGNDEPPEPAWFAVKPAEPKAEEVAPATEAAEPEKVNAG